MPRQRGPGHTTAGNLGGKGKDEPRGGAELRVICTCCLACALADPRQPLGVRPRATVDRVEQRKQRSSRGRTCVGASRQTLRPPSRCVALSVPHARQGIAVWPICWQAQNSISFQVWIRMSKPTQVLLNPLVRDQKGLCLRSPIGWRVYRWIYPHEAAHQVRALQCYRTEKTSTDRLSMACASQAELSKGPLLVIAPRRPPVRVRLAPFKEALLSTVGKRTANAQVGRHA